MENSEVNTPVARTSSQFFRHVDLPVFFLSGGISCAFVFFALYDLPLLTRWVDASFQVAVTYFGAFWQFLMLLTFLIALVMAFMPTGKVKLGGISTPSISTFNWASMIMCTLLAGGGVFWAAAEPIAHFMAQPPIFSQPNTTTPEMLAFNALAQSYLHWGFLAWSIVGSLTSIIFMYLHYHEGLPLKPRILLYPIFGKKILTNSLGTLVDASCILAVLAGTVGPIGFLGLQVGQGLELLFGVINNYKTQMVILMLLVVIYTLSCSAGIQKGIQRLSQINVLLAIGLMAFIIFFGPTAFIFDGYLHSFGLHVNQFIPMATFRGDKEWLTWWTVFFWGWFIGYGPLMAMFITRISKGRSIREIIVLLSLIAPVITCFWFTILGGTGLGIELESPGAITKAFESFDLPSGLLAITSHLPFSTLMTCLFLILTTIFVATTGDSMTLAISMATTGDDKPNAGIRVFWGVMMGIMAAVLISMGDGGIKALQSVIVITAMPVSLVLLPSLWIAPKIAMKLSRKSVHQAHGLADVENTA